MNNTVVLHKYKSEAKKSKTLIFWLEGAERQQKQST